MKIITNIEIEKGLEELKRNDYKYIIKANDKILGEWDIAKNRKRLQLIGAKSHEDLDIILENLKKDDSFNYINYYYINDLKGIKSAIRGKSWTLRNDWTRAFDLQAKKHYLSTEYDTAKSFYKKAIVKACYKNGILYKIELYSYDTLVLTINNGKYNLNYSIAKDLLFSNTTLRHIKETLKQYRYLLNDIKNATINTKKDIIKYNNYTKKEVLK